VVLHPAPLVVAHRHRASAPVATMFTAVERFSAMKRSSAVERDRRIHRRPWTARRACATLCRVPIGGSSAALAGGTTRRRVGTLMRRIRRAGALASSRGGRERRGLRWWWTWPPLPTGRDSRRSARRWRLAACSAVIMIVTASCASRPAPRRGPRTEAQIIEAGIDRSLPRSTYAAQAAVLRTWISGEQLYYHYMDEPPAPLRADLIAGEHAGQLFPLARLYATGQSLQSEYLTLMNMKLSLLNGPTRYDLGHPRIISFTGTEATVSWCATDSGTTTQNGNAGPVTLDGGPGGARGTSEFTLTSGRWLGFSGSSESVRSCGK
jgi:hypothetical protein